MAHLLAAVRSEMRFYLGVHRPQWLPKTTVPLFVSRVTLAPRRTLPQAAGPFAIDSGGFSEIDRNHGWTIGAAEYAAFVGRVVEEVGRPDFVAPQDWMVEERMLTKTGLSIVEHQRRTVENFLELRGILGELVIPVLQGWTLDDYLECTEMYAAAGVELAEEPLVGLGTICRRQHELPAERIVRRLAAEKISLHGFGVKTSGLERYGDALTSADSMAWSMRARYLARNGEPSCDPSRRDDCANCLHFALDWRENLVSRLEVKGCAA